MRSRTVTFKFDPGPKPITADDVVRTMRTMLGATGDLSLWRIKKMSLASPFEIVAVCGEEMYRPIAAFANSMKLIERGTKKATRLTGTAAKLLDSVDYVTRNYFGSVRIATSVKSSVTMNHDSVEKARQATGQLTPSLMMHAREQIGQLRGYLEQVTAKRGQPARFGIRDRVTSVIVPCVIPEGDESLFAIALNGLRRHVVVSGLIRYGEQSQASSIKAGAIEILEDFVIPFDKLPRAPLTERGDSVAQIRRLRDG